MKHFPVARIVHEIDGRIRFRVVAQRGQQGYFETAGALLAKCPGVLSVQLNPGTGSILVLHRTAASDITDFALEHQLFQVSRQDASPAPERTGMSLDINHVLIASIVGMAIFQISRGRVFGPASTLLFNAAQLAGLVAANPFRRPPDDGET